MSHDESLARAETYLTNLLTASTPPRDPASYNITAAAQDYRQAHGDWDLSGADDHALEELLRRHAKVGEDR